MAYADSNGGRSAQHGHLVATRVKPNNMPDTDPSRITALEPVRDVQRVALALASAAKQALVQAVGANSSQMKAATLRDWHTVN